MFPTMAHNRDKLWQDYWENRDNDSILRLINSYAPLLESIAEEVIPEHPGTVSLDDLITAGVFEQNGKN